ncbi:MAG: 3-methyladenine DNA glycosylase, partial [Mycobacterium sp.]
VAGPLRCSHFDAFRFFSAAFKADMALRNVGSPSRATQQDWEQPGCLHANMDLYKWSYKLSPLIDSELLLDCLDLAAAAREIDMRASPYDLRSYGYAPIAVENPAGRAEYVRCQRAIAARAAPLRAALLDRCDLLLQAARVPEFGLLAGRLDKTS